MISGEIFITFITHYPSLGYDGGRISASLVTQNICIALYTSLVGLGSDEINPIYNRHPTQALNYLIKLIHHIYIDRQPHFQLCPLSKTNCKSILFATFKPYLIFYKRYHSLLIMRLPLTTILSIIGFSSLSQAAECYAQSGGSSCVKHDELFGFGPSWCAQNYNVLQGDWWTYRDSRGNTALIGKIGNFANPQQCALAYDEIMVCHGKKNGGSWSASGVSLNINFCAWAPVVACNSFQVEDNYL